MGGRMWQENFKPKGLTGFLESYRAGKWWSNDKGNVWFFIMVKQHDIQEYSMRQWIGSETCRQASFITPLLAEHALCLWFLFLTYIFLMNICACSCNQVLVSWISHGTKSIIINFEMKFWQHNAHTYNNLSTRLIHASCSFRQKLSIWNMRESAVV